MASHTSVRPSAAPAAQANGSPAPKIVQPIPIGSRGAIYTVTAAAGDGT